MWPPEPATPAARDDPCRGGQPDVQHGRLTPTPTPAQTPHPPSRSAAAPPHPPIDRSGIEKRAGRAGAVHHADLSGSRGRRKRAARTSRLARNAVTTVLGGPKPSGSWGYQRGRNRWTGAKGGSVRRHALEPDGELFLLAAVRVPLLAISSVVVWLLPPALLAVLAALYGWLPALIVNLVLYLLGVPESWAEPVAVMVIATVFVGLLFLLADFLSTPVQRLSVRLSPLPLGRSARLRLGPVLVLSLALSTATLAAFLVRLDSLPVLLAAMGCFATYAAVCLRKAAILRRGWKGWPPQGSVLFLRTFGGTAERVLVSSLIASSRGRLVLLLGRRQSMALWDPLLIGLNSSQHVPMYVRTGNHDWQAQVRTLISQAHRVVLDVTEWSEGVAVEKQIVDEAGYRGRTLLIRRYEDPPPTQGTPDADFVYRTSWRSLDEDRLLGAFLVLVAAFLMLPPIAGLAWLNGLAGMIVWALLFVRRHATNDDIDALSKLVSSLGPH